MNGYENPDIPEGINVTQEHPLKEFGQLVIGVTALIIILALAFSELGAYAARHLTLEQEVALAHRMLPAMWTETAAEPAEQAERKHLQDLADRLARHMAIPAAMPVTVHYSAEPVVNAMATLGGHIVVYQGLLDATKDSETALAMVMAHELAHIKLRHPATAMGRGFAVALLLSTFAGLGDNVMQGWANSVGTLTALRYSREQEAAADSLALETVYREYGTVKGAEIFFEHASAEDNGLTPPAILSTHPSHEERIRKIQNFAAKESGAE
ncbi:MAG: M48 family metallopeptidase [Cellvibrionales bacterium]|jgi:predicted Zn-dependent protease|nr:M48 family metallopeptidase [Cellvibrionales bacterium]